MLHADDFRRIKESPVAAHFQFLLKDRSPNSIHAFFEGYGDGSFYTNFLLTFSSDRQIHPYRCGNKEGVYATYRKVMQREHQGITLFFVDKDLSDILNESWEKAPNIYVTDYYSIESYLVSTEILYRIWMELFRFRPDFLEFSSFYRAKFHEELERFYQFTRPIMAWSIYLRRQGKRPNINNINFSRFFAIRNDLTLEEAEGIGTTEEIKLLERVCGETTSEEWFTDVKLIMEELQELPPKAYLRGKLELGFFVKFVNALLEYLRSNLAQDGGNVSTKTPLTEENAIEILGPRSRIPPSLEDFLRENLFVSSPDK